MEKRFRIFNADEQKLIGKYVTMYEVAIKLIALENDGCYYFVDDTVDDIEVPGDDIIDAHRAGESFKDLQAF